MQNFDHQFQSQTKESLICINVKYKYTDENVNSSTKTDDREEEGNEATEIPVTIVVFAQTPHNLRDNLIQVALSYEIKVAQGVIF